MATFPTENKKSNQGKERVNMKKVPVKERFLHFVIILIVSTLLGYLYSDLINGIFLGILIGIGFVVIGEGMIGERQNKK